MIQKDNQELGKKNLKRCIYYLIGTVIIYLLYHFTFLTTPILIEKQFDNIDNKYFVKLRLDNTSKIKDSVVVDTISFKKAAAIYIKGKYDKINKNELENTVDAVFRFSGSLKELEGIKFNYDLFDILHLDRRFLDIIFWSLFGVLTNLIYSASQALRNGTYDPSEEPVYWSKIIYTPFISIVLVVLFPFLISPLISHNVEFEVGNSNPVVLISYSFITGFYSRRALELLNKIKDAVLPEGITDEVSISILGKIIFKDGHEIQDGSVNDLIIMLKGARDTKITHVKDAEDLYYQFDKIPLGKYILYAKSSELNDKKVPYESPEYPITIRGAENPYRQDIVLE